jgi:hypothetical protein
MKYLITIVFLYTGMAYGQYSLGLNLEKGSSYIQNINASVTINTEMNGQKVTITSTMNGLSRSKLIRSSADEFELESSFDSLHVTWRSPMGWMEFGSGAQNSMANKHINITLLKNGSIKNIHNPDTAGLAGILKFFPAADQIRKMLMMSGHMKHSFNAKELREKMQMLTALYPDKPVKLNEEWGSTIKMDSASNGEIRTRYTLVDVSSGIATIKGNNSLKAAGTKKQGSRFSATYDINGTSESTFKADIKTGWIMEADIRHHLTGFIQCRDSTTANGTDKRIPIDVSIVEKLSSK